MHINLNNSCKEKWISCVITSESVSFDDIYKFILWIKGILNEELGISLVPYLWMRMTVSESECSF